MDSMTHALAGTLVAKTGFSQRMGKAATAAFTTAAVIPDIDSILRLWGTQFYLEHHRGFTHSFFGAAILALTLGLLFSLFTRSKRYWSWTGIIFLGILLHIALDLATSFGTMIFYPLSHQRYAWDLLFIIDFYVTGTILFSLTLTYLFKARSSTSAKAGLLLLIGYFVLAALNHASALERVKEEAKAKGIVALKVAAFPMPFSPFRWSGVLEAPEATYQSWFSVLDRTPLALRIYPRISLEGPLKAAEDEEIVKFFRWFARFPIVEVKASSPGLVVQYFDLRFHATPERQVFLVQVRFDQQGRVVGSGLIGL